jgi:membrane protease YdiL (CAAX protease family)
MLDGKAKVLKNILLFVIIFIVWRSMSDTASDFLDTSLRGLFEHLSISKNLDTLIYSLLSLVLLILSAVSCRILSNDSRIQLVIKRPLLKPTIHKILLYSLSAVLSSSFFYIISSTDLIKNFHHGKILQQFYKINVLILFIVFLRAFSEELMWRKLYFSIFDKNNAALKYIILNAFIFALWHIFDGYHGLADVVNIFFLVGLPCAVIYARTKSVMSTTLYHSFVNLVSFFLQGMSEISLKPIISDQFNSFGVLVFWTVTCIVLFRIWKQSSNREVTGIVDVRANETLN